MDIKIALLSAEHSFDNIAPILPAFAQQCRIQVFRYGKLSEVVALYQENEGLFDAFLFSGWLPYAVVCGACGEIEKPHAFFGISEGDFFRTMFRLAVEHPGIDYRRVMVDDPQLDMDMTELFPAGGQFLINSFYPLEYAMQTVTLQRGGEEADGGIYAVALEAYRSAWRANNIDVVVTRLANLSPMLTQAQIAHYVLAPSAATMHNCLERLLYQVGSGHYVDMLSVCGVLEMAGGEETAQRFLRAMHVFARKSGIELFPTWEEGQIHLAVSHSHFQRITENRTVCRLSAFLREAADADFQLGWGVGYDVVQAKQNAVRALRLSRHSGARCAFLTDEGGIVTGPLGSARLRFQAENSQTVIAMSDRYDISRMHVKRILAMIEQRRDNRFTSEELAEGLGISQRSARRILVKLSDTGGAVPLEENKTGLRGRPSLRYTISLI